MTDDEVQAYLESERVLNVATIGPTGHPHLVAMWYAMVDGKPAFWTFGKSQKILNLRRDPKMTGLVESGDTYDQLRGVELVGAGRSSTTTSTILEIGKAVGVKYNGPSALERRGAAVPRGPGRQARRRRLRGRARRQLGSHQARRQLLTR